MSYPGFHESFLQAQFREFYEVILRLKGAVRTPSAVPVANNLPDGSPGRELPVQAIHQELLSALENQALEAERNGGAFAYEVYREAQYVFAALADEVFLNLDWPGRTDWPLLESRLFQSHGAGELFFEKLNRLLLQRGPAYEDLAGVFFLALALGFRGKFRGTGNNAQIDRYRRDLFLMVFHQPPHLSEEDVSLFPQSYLHTLREGGSKKLPDPRNWLALIPAVILIWLLVTTLLWRGLAQKIDSILCRIDSAACYDSSGGH